MTENVSEANTLRNVLRQIREVAANKPLVSADAIQLRHEIISLVDLNLATPSSYGVTSEPEVKANSAQHEEV